MRTREKWKYKIMQEIKDLISSMVNVPTQVITGKVKSVDEAKMLCVVTPDEEGADYNNVRLRAQDNELDTGVMCVPKVNSSVAIARLYNDSDTFFVILTSEVEKIVVKGEKLSFAMNLENNAGLELNFDSNKVKIKISGDDLEIDTQGEIKFNGGGNGGMVLKVPVNTFMNEIANAVQLIINAFNTHTHPVSGALAGITTGLISGSAPVVPAIENTKIKQ